MFPIFKEEENAQQDREIFLSGHQFLDDELSSPHHDKKSNKMNVRMFNFSKVVNQARYQESR